MRVATRSNKWVILKGLLLTPLLLSAVVSIAIASWFLLYSGDLPSFDALNRFSPSSADIASDCQGQQIPVTPYASMGSFLPVALRAVEGNDSVISLQIARYLFCNKPHGHISRELLEIKASFQIRHRFTSQQITAIYLNEAYFGDGIYGVDSASQHFYGRKPSELSSAEAAMLVGMMKSPTLYSPRTHPDRARSRRNEVLRGMVKSRALTEQEAETAMQSPVIR